MGARLISLGDSNDDRHSDAAGRDAVVIALVIGGVIAANIAWGPFDAVQVLSVATAGMGVFGIRRWIDLRREAERHRGSQSLLRAGLDNTTGVGAADERVLASEAALEVEEASGPYAVCSISRDVTTRLRTEEALRQAQKMEGIGRLAGGVAHDLNNILGVIIGQAELLGRRRDPADDARRIGEIGKAAQRGTRMARQLLAFSRKQRLEPKTLRLQDIVREMEDMLRRLIGEHIQVEL